MAFFKDLGSKITNVSGNAISKVQNFSNSVALKAKIADEEKSIANAYEQIGKLYYQNHKEDFEQEFAGFFQAIDNCNNRIADYNGQLESLKDTEHCTKCGAEIIPGNKFCQVCGAKIENANVQADGKVCPSCGKVLPKEMNFCTGCGTKLQ